jgi:hypothetical protein
MCVLGGMAGRGGWPHVNLPGPGLGGPGRVSGSFGDPPWSPAPSGRRKPVLLLGRWHHSGPLGGTARHGCLVCQTFKLAGLVYGGTCTSTGLLFVPQERELPRWLVGWLVGRPQSIFSLDLISFLRWPLFKAGRSGGWGLEEQDGENKRRRRSAAGGRRCWSSDQRPCSTGLIRLSRRRACIRVSSAAGFHKQV